MQILGYVTPPQQNATSSKKCPELPLVVKAKPFIPLNFPENFVITRAKVLWLLLLWCCMRSEKHLLQQAEERNPRLKIAAV